MIFCTACGTESDDQRRFCDQCGMALAIASLKLCASCEWRNRSSAKFCANCGNDFATATPLAPIAPSASTAPAVAEPVTATPTPEIPAPGPPTSAEPAVPVEELAEEPAPGPGFAWGSREAAPAPATSKPTPETEAPAATVAATEIAAPPPQVTRTPERPRTDEPPPEAVDQGPPPPPTRPFSESAREWAASRQADILLYLGAFLLVAAALLFVGSQGEELSPGLRVGLLLVYTFAFIAAGLAAQRSDRIREAGMVFLAIGALITPLNFVLIYTELLEERDVSRSVIWLIGSIYSGLFYGLLYQRGYGRLYAVPAALAAISAWAALFAVLRLPTEWFGTWWIVFVLLLSLIARQVGELKLNAAWTLGFAIWVIFAAQVVTSDLGGGSDGRVPLPVSLGLITGWFALIGWSLRAPQLLPWGATVAIFAGSTALRAFDLDADWWAYSPLAVGFAAVFTRRWWAHWNLAVSRVGWLYAAACGVTPLLFIAAYEDGAHGAVAFLLGTAVLASVAWRDQFDGFGLFDAAERGAPTDLTERVGFAWIGFVLGLIGVGYAQRELGIAAPDTGWSYLAITVATIAPFVWTGRRWTPALAVFIPPAVLAMLVSLPDPEVYPGHVALNLGVTAAALVGGFAVTRRWLVTLVAGVVAAFAAAAAWDALGWEAWTLAAAYSGAGAALFAVLTKHRGYRLDDSIEELIRGSTAVVLSWGFVLLGPIVAFLQILPVEAGTGPEVIASTEYRTGLYLLLVIAALLLYEGWRSKNWNVTAVATTLAAVVAAPLWASYGWPGWTLAVAYFAVGTIRFATMTTARTYARELKQTPILFLSWGMTLAAVVTAWISLADRMASEGGAAVELVEYRTLIGVIAAHVPLLLFEARRLRLLWALVTASVAAMTALLLTIGAFQFDQVQAYTVPVGLYWIAFGLVVRRSAPILDRHLMLHELVLLGGVGIMLAPQIGLGLQADGAAWGGIIMLEGVVFLLVGLVLGARWLTVSGVVAISGVAIRWLAVNTGDTIPYWLTLGGVGLGLLLLGTVLLLARERWMAVKDSTTSWWARTATLRGVGIEWPVVLAPAAVAVIAMIAAGIEDWIEPLV